MIKAIIFDVGGVLLRTQNHQPRRTWEKELNLRPWESEKIVFSSDAGTAAQMGEIGDEALWDWVGQHLQLSDDALAKFRRDFWAGDQLDNGLVELSRHLRPAYKTAIISNATDRLRQELTEKHQIADAFDLIVCSAEEGIMKPHPAIYERTIERLQCRPQEAVFIDDAPANVEGAREVGLNAIHYQEGLDVGQALQRWGISVPESRDLTGESNQSSSGGQPHA